MVQTDHKTSTFIWNGDMGEEGQECKTEKSIKFSTENNDGSHSTLLQNDTEQCLANIGRGTTPVRSGRDDVGEEEKGED